MVSQYDDYDFISEMSELKKKIEKENQYLLNCVLIFSIISLVEVNFIC